MCLPSLTELCRYLFIKESVRFPAGSGRLLFTAAEQQPENGTAQRAAVQHLPAQGHGHVAAPGVHPGAEARLLEQQRCHQAHHRAHDADDHQRDGIGDELRPVGGLHESESQCGGQLFHHKELQHKGYRHHDGHFVQGHAEGGVGHAAGGQCHVVNDHAIDHDGSHDDGEDDFFR